MGSEADVKKAWQRIEAWFQERASEYVGWLRPPADAAAIQKAEAELKVKLPDDYRASLQVHDGQDPGGNEIFGSWGLYSVGEVLRTWQWLQDQVKDGSLQTKDDPEIKADPTVHPRPWDPAWIPIAPKGTGDYLMLDLDPKDASCRGQVITWSSRSSKRAVVAKDFGAWLEQNAKDFESGVWNVDDDGALERA